MSELNNAIFDDVVVEDLTLPWRETPYRRHSFADPRLRSISAFVVEDSKVGNNRLTSLVLKFPRTVLAEFNTHRVFSRNSASSRARSVKATIKEVIENPYIPLWTINKAGMSGHWASPRVEAEATEVYLAGRDAAVRTALALLVGSDRIEGFGRDDKEIASRYSEVVDYYYDHMYSGTGAEPDFGLSVHKQVLNRVLEPYMFHEVIVTSSYFDNFLKLRDHNEADPAIWGVSHLLGEAIAHSEPTISEIHAPFSSNLEKTLILGQPWPVARPHLIKSAMESAQISYNDKSRAIKSTATAERGESLLTAGHLSPFEHVAVATRLLSRSLALRSVFCEFRRHGKQLSHQAGCNCAPYWPVLQNSQCARGLTGSTIRVCGKVMV